MIKFVSQSTNPYPDWLKNHQVFEKLDRIDKIFPKIGLPNFKQEIEVVNSTDATNYGNVLWQRLCGELANKGSSLLGTYLSSLSNSGRERNERCNKLRRLTNLSVDFDHALRTTNPVEVVNKKVALSLKRDVFDGGKDPAPVFRSGQSVFKCFADFNTQLREAGIPAMEIEQLAEYKSFNQFNVPATKYTVHFSSTNAEGAWDIATASMRGISSCQKWDSTQSRGLIGSVASKYLAILYVVSKNEKTDYGQKMLHRCMVRLVLNKNTLEPVLLLDRMYPTPLPDFIKAFKDMLHQRSGLRVIAHNDEGNKLEEIKNSYMLLDEVSRTFLKKEECSYQDTAMPVQTNNSSISKFKQEEAKLIGSSSNLLETVQKELITKLTNEVEKRRAHYRKVVPEIELFNKERAKFEAGGILDQFTMTPPTIEAGFSDLRRGYIAYKNTLNLLTWFENENKGGSSTKTFLEIIFKQFEQPGANFPLSTRNRTYRYLLIQFSKNFNAIREKAWAEVEKGAWMQSHGKSAKRFFETMLEDLKVALRQAWQDSI